jgi:hypothetical protein
MSALVSATGKHRNMQELARRTLLAGAPTHTKPPPLLLARLAGAPLTAAVDQGKGKPNIVILPADDPGWTDAGLHGSEIKTPALDRLAARALPSAVVTPFRFAARRPVPRF